MAIDVTINGKSLTSDYLCIISQVSITALRKKEYTVDLPCADGSRDLTAWFGAPRFEMQTLTIELISAAEGASAVADKMTANWLGQTVKVELSCDDQYYREGIVSKIVPSGAEVSGAIRLDIACQPCRYFATERTYAISAGTAKDYTWVNAGAIDVVPELTASESSVVIQRGTATYTLSPGKYLLAGLSIPANDQIDVTVSGGALAVRYREAIR